MPKNASLAINEIDKTQAVGEATTNISGIIIDAEMGPINDTSTVFTSPQQFERIHGGVKADRSNIASYLSAIRALQNGSALRVCNIKNFISVDNNVSSAIKAAATNTNLYTFSKLLVANQKITISFQGYTIVQQFVQSHQKTLDELVLKILSAYQITWAMGDAVVLAKRLGNRLLILMGNNSSGTITVTPSSNAAIAAVRATATLTVGDIGAAGDVITMYGGSVGGSTITLGTYTRQAGDTTAALVATGVRAAINARTSIHGFSAAGSNADIVTSAPVGSGSSANKSYYGLNYYYSTYGNYSNASTQFSGGVTAVAGTGDTAPTVSSVASNSIINSVGEVLFEIVPKYAGKKYNDLIVEVTSSTTYGAFNLRISLLNSNLPSEYYPNLQISNFAIKDFLKKVDEDSLMASVVYTPSTLTGSPLPVETIIKYSGGSDGGPVTVTDILGSSIHKSGFYAFDGFDDLFRLAVGFELPVEADLISMHIEGANYAKSRKDLSYFACITGNTKEAIADIRNQILADTSYVRYYTAGKGIKILDATDNTIKYINPIGDIIGIAAASANNYGPWFSYANSNRGALSRVLGVGNEWGSSGNAVDLEYLAGQQINSVIQSGKSVMIWGNFTGQSNLSQLSYASIRDLLIFIRKSLKPTLLPFLEEPNDTNTWMSIYSAIRPFFVNLENGRALQRETDGGWKWEGDQFADSMLKLTVNNFSDVQLGKYKVRLSVKPINSLQEFILDIFITPSSVNVEEAI